jgi:colanic acid/amylovoran biosynthesis glycosyltransferase
VGIGWPVETFLRNRLEGLARAGLEVTAALTAPRWRAAGARMEGVRLLRLPHWNDPLLLRLLQAGRAGARRAMGRLRPDVVHFEWNSVAIDFWSLVETWRRPAVISCRGSQILVRPHTPGQEAFVRGLERTLREAAAVHCVSEAIRREAMRYGLDPAKARVIRPAVDAQFFHPREKQPHDVLRVVSVASLAWVKGHEYALLALKRLAESGVPASLDILGDGKKSEQQRVQYGVRDLGLQHQVRLRGALPPVAVRDALQQADVFLLASVSEGISNAALEAMACGTPVVTTGCGGMREAVTDAVEGFVVPVRDPEAMALALERLARQPELRRRLGEAARQRVEREFTLDRQIGEFVDLYQALAA